MLQVICLLEIRLHFNRKGSSVQKIPMQGIAFPALHPLELKG